MKHLSDMPVNEYLLKRERLQQCTLKAKLVRLAEILRDAILGPMDGYGPR